MHLSNCKISNLSLVGDKLNYFTTYLCFTHSYTIQSPLQCMTEDPNMKESGGITRSTDREHTTEKERLN